MSNTIFKRFSFGYREDDLIYFYEFKVHTYVGANRTISTVMLNADNVYAQQLDLLRQNIPGLVKFIAELCVEHDAHYDGFHNQLYPLSDEESENVVDLVNAAIKDHLSL